MQEWIDDEQRHAVDTAHARALTEVLEQTRHDGDGEADLTAARGDIGESLVARARVRECDGVDGVLSRRSARARRTSRARPRRGVSSTRPTTSVPASRKDFSRASATAPPPAISTRSTGAVERVEAGDQHRGGAGSGHGQQRVQRGQAVARDILDECQAEGEPGERER